MLLNFKKWFVLPLLILSLATPAIACDDEELAGGIIGSILVGVIGHRVSNGRTEATLLSVIFGGLLGSAAGHSIGNENLKKRISENETAAARTAFGEDFNPRNVFNWSVPRGNDVPRSIEDLLVVGYYNFETHGFYDGMYCRSINGIMYNYATKSPPEVLSGFYCKVNDGALQYFPQEQIVGKTYVPFDKYVQQVDNEKSEIRKKKRECRKAPRRPIGYTWGCWDGHCSYRTF